MLTLSTASASASIWARRLFSFLPQRIDGGDAQYIAIQLAGQFVVLEHDVKRLIPRHVIEHDRQIAVDHGIEHNVQTADLVNQAEEIFQIHILKIDRDRLASVLGAVRRRLLLHLDLLFGGQIHGRLDAACDVARSLPEGGICGGGDQFRRRLVGKTARRFLGLRGRAAQLLSSFTEYLGSTKAKSAGFRGVLCRRRSGRNRRRAAGVTGAEATGAEASTSFGAALAAADFAAGAGLAMGHHGIVDIKNEAAVRTRHQFMLAAAAGARSRSTTTRVVGGTCPSIPTRTSFTPSRPTLMRLCAVAITVLGKSTTMRAGESSVVTLGANCARRFELDPQSVLAVSDLEPLQCSARGHPLARHVSRGGDQHERQQRNQETQQLLSHFPISPCEAVSPPCVSSNVFLEIYCLQA